MNRRDATTAEKTRREKILLTMRDSRLLHCEDAKVGTKGRVGDDENERRKGADEQRRREDAKVGSKGPPGVGAHLDTTTTRSDADVTLPG